MSQIQGIKTSVIQDQNGLSATQEKVSTYSPYPPADLIRGLEEIESGLGHRVIAMAEAEQRMHHEAARHQMSEATKVNDSNIANQKNLTMLMFLGLGAALVVAGAVLYVVVHAIDKNQPWVAGEALFALIGVLTILVLRKPHDTTKED